jgi:hypothetical protein
MAADHADSCQRNYQFGDITMISLGSSRTKSLPVLDAG